MNVYNMAGIISLIIKRKIVKFSIEFNFFYVTYCNTFKYCIFQTL